MFKITPVSEVAEAKSISEALSLPYFEGAFYYKMFDMDSGDLMGVSVFELYRDYGELLALKEVDGKNDFEAMFILIRQTMNFINLCGYTKCIARTTYAPKKMLVCAGFVKDEDERFVANLEGMFDGHCHTHAN